MRLKPPTHGPGAWIISSVHVALEEAGYAAQNRHEKVANRSDERFPCHTIAVLTKCYPCDRQEAYPKKHERCARLQMALAKRGRDVNDNLHNYTAIHPKEASGSELPSCFGSNGRS